MRGAHAAVFRHARPTLDTTLPRAEGFTYAANVWDLCLVQGPFFVAPCQTLATFSRDFFAAVLHRVVG